MSPGDILFGVAWLYLHAWVLLVPCIPAAYLLGRRRGKQPR
jgi:hypothetical protein